MSKPQIPHSIRSIQPACTTARLILNELCEMVAPGVPTMDIELRSQQLMREHKVKSMAIGQRASSGQLFPGYVCIAINDEVNHGYATPGKIINEGDLVSIDVVVRKNGWCGDNSRSVVAGGDKANARAAKLIACSEDCLNAAIAAAKTGNHVNDISVAIESTARKAGFNVVHALAGHGIGKSNWEEPTVVNFDTGYPGQRLKEFQAIAMDININEGKSDVVFDKKDGWTVRTKDGGLSACIEDTFYVSRSGGVVLTI